MAGWLEWGTVGITGTRAAPPYRGMAPWHAHNSPSKPCQHAPLVSKQQGLQGANSPHSRQPIAQTPVQKLATG